MTLQKKLTPKEIIELHDQMTRYRGQDDALFVVPLVVLALLALLVLVLLTGGPVGPVIAPGPGQYLMR